MTRPDRQSCARYRRWIDSAFVRGALAQRRWERLRGHIADCGACRERFDRLAIAVRGADAPPLFPGAGARMPGDAGRDRTPRRWWLGLGAATTAAAAVAALVIGMWPATTQHDGTMTARGRDAGADTPWTGDRTPGVRLFCVSSDVDQRARVTGEARAAELFLTRRTLQCKMNDELQLVYSTPSLAGLTMAVFSRDESDDVRWYAPAAPDAQTIDLMPGAIDEPVPWSTRLSVNHTPGTYDVTVRVFDRPLGAATAARDDTPALLELRARLVVTPARGVQ